MHPCDTYIAVSSEDSSDLQLNINEYERLVTIATDREHYQRQELLSFEGRWGQECFIIPARITGISVWTAKAAETYIEYQKHCKLKGLDE